MISRITILLVLLCMYSRMCSRGEFMMSVLGEKDIELEREVQSLNKRPKKTFMVCLGEGFVARI